jgi:hypothetical protein
VVEEQCDDEEIEIDSWILDGDKSLSGRHSERSEESSPHEYWILTVASLPQDDRINTIHVINNNILKSQG